MSVLAAIVALLKCLPEILELIRKLERAEHVKQVLGAANKAIDLLDGADTPEKKKNAAKAIADFWADPQ